jgi:membrane dipeptidase
MVKPFMSLLLLFSFNTYSQSYQKLHKDAVVIDTHNDVLSTVTMRGHNIEKDLTGKSHSDIARFIKGGVDIQVFSVFCDERFGKDTAFEYANIEIDSLYAIVSRNKNEMVIVTDPAGLRRAVKQGKLGCMIGVEGGHMIEDNLNNLVTLYTRGARYLTLTWNNSTSWATSAWDETKKKDSLPHIGLTEMGKNIVRKMNELGMMVDVSHVGEQTFWDVISTSTKPVIASHSCVYTLCPVPRNLRDDQIKAIGRNGGVIHLNFYSGFLDSNYNRKKDVMLSAHQKQVDSLKGIKKANWEIEEWIMERYPSEAQALRAPLSMLIDHLDYIVRLIGVDHVGIGSDFDGIESAPQGLDDVASLPLLTKALMERGYTKKEIKKILGGNFIRVFNAVQP